MKRYCDKRTSSRVQGERCDELALGGISLALLFALACGEVPPSGPSTEESAGIQQSLTSSEVHDDVMSPPGLSGAERLTAGSTGEQFEYAYDAATTSALPGYSVSCVATVV